MTNKANWKDSQCYYWENSRTLNWAIFNSKVLNYQMVILWIGQRNPAPVDIVVNPHYLQGFNHTFGGAGFRNHPQYWDNNQLIQ